MRLPSCHGHNPAVFANAGVQRIWGMDVDILDVDQCHAESFQGAAPHGMPATQPPPELAAGTDAAGCNRTSNSTLLPQQQIAVQHSGLSASLNTKPLRVPTPPLRCLQLGPGAWRGVAAAAMNAMAAIHRAAPGVCRHPASC